MLMAKPHQSSKHPLLGFSFFLNQRQKLVLERSSKHSTDLSDPSDWVRMQLRVWPLEEPK